MIDLSPYRKNKINLEDYDYTQDIKLRILLADSTPLDIELLEEIIYNPARFPVLRLAEDLEMSIEEIMPSIEKFGKMGLISLDGQNITVDKELRKYFEGEIKRFEDGYIPDMEFVQTLLRKVTIHALPIWYLIPRSSNSIFNSVVEKYLFTPVLFERYLKELNLGGDILSALAQDVLTSKDLCVNTDNLQKKHNLSREAFLEHVLHLEFNFVCSISYLKVGDHYEEVLTPFREWREYLFHMRKIEPTTINDAQTIVRRRPSDYSFIEDITSLTEILIKQDVKYIEGKPDQDCMELLKKKIASFPSEKEYHHYCELLLEKMVLLNLIQIEKESICPLEEAKFWLTLPLEKRALTSFKNGYIALITHAAPSSDLFNERNLREVEKSMVRNSGKGWITFDDYIRSLTMPLSDETKIELKKVGKSWRYTLPCYTDKEIELVEKVILEWLFESGLVALGTFENKLCLTVTELGKKIFSE